MITHADLQTQAQERAAQATSQADAMQQQYEAAWAGAEDSHRTGKRLLDSLTKVLVCEAPPNRRHKYELKRCSLARLVTVLQRLSHCHLCYMLTSLMKLMLYVLVPSCTPSRYSHVHILNSISLLSAAVCLQTSRDLLLCTVPLLWHRVPSPQITQVLPASPQPSSLIGSEVSAVVCTGQGQEGGDDHKAGGAGEGHSPTGAAL